jgi:uncharacterized cupin superfamily protein
VANVFDDQFSGRLDLSSDETAMYVYDVEPGGSFPYHYEYVEEWLLVVDGTIVVRAPEGESELGRGDLLRFPAGPDGAHQIVNRSDRAARLLLFSKTAVPAASVYPDSDAIGVWPDDETEFYFKRGAAISREEALDEGPPASPH